MTGTGYRRIEEISNADAYGHKARLRWTLCAAVLGVASTVAIFCTYTQSSSGRQIKKSTQALGEREEVIVQLARGSVRGVEVELPYGQAKRFLGIPYGQAKRFHNVEPAKEIIGEYDARVSRPTCLRLHSHSSERRNEDCLHMDIYTPSPTEQGTNFSVPVVIHIHGMSCNSHWGLHDGTRFWTRDAEVLVPVQNVVVVKVSYRLDIFGFLGSERIRVARNASVGNFATWDIQLALRWVNNNIQYFGGDFNAICLLGWSTGAALISVLMSMPSSTGLFHSAIMMSGGFADWTTSSMETSELMYDQILEATGCVQSQSCLEPGPPCECLLEKTADELVAASMTLSPWWAAVVDGITLTKTPWESLLAGETLKKIPVILGGVQLDADQEIGPQATESDFDRILASPYPGLGVPPSMLSEAKQIYWQDLDLPTGRTQNHSTAHWSRAYWATRQAFADQSKVCWARRAAQHWRAKTGAEAYYYWFKARCPRVAATPYAGLQPSGPDVPLNIGHCCVCPGNSHGEDINCFLFGQHIRRADHDSIELADTMRGLFKNMVYRKNPNEGTFEMQETWRPMPEGGMQFDTGRVVFLPDLKSAECNFWDGVTGVS